MQEFWKSAARAGGMAVVAVAAAVGVFACGASPTGGNDPNLSTYFKGTMVEGAVLPFIVRLPGDLTSSYLTDARLVPLDIGRTTDTRIFDDRGGSGGSGGGGRDTTAVTGRMSDIRVFASTPQGANAQIDSVTVDVVRIGNILYITRPHPDPARNVTDTAQYVSGVLVRKLSYWRTLVEPPNGKLLTYTTVR